jgi:nucleotide-binding universal stress UspA family protein
MEKKLLLAVDDSHHSENALRYVAEVSRLMTEAHVVLFHVQPTISQYLLDEARSKPKARAKLDKMIKAGQKEAHALLSRHKALLSSLGVADERVQLISHPRRSGAAKDILEHSNAKLYDAIVLGRRGLSGLTEIFAGSVSGAIVENSELIPVWLVDERVVSFKIMVAVDGSPSALRAVDHMAFILENNPSVQITFFHVAPRLKDVCPVNFADEQADDLESIIQQGDQACIDRFFSHAVAKLQQAGIQEHQISVESNDSALRVGKAIMNAYDKGRFNTLVIGRRGMDKKFFTGSVSRYVINRFSGGALWVVP